MNTADDVTGPVNLGKPGEFKILELAEKIIDLTNSRSEIIFKPIPVDGPMQRKPDITLAREILEWEPEVVLEGGLKKTIAYFEELLRSPLG